MNKSPSSLTFNKILINGVEIKCCRKTPQSYKQHLHSELSIGYILEGSSCVKLGEETYDFSAGDGIIIPPFVSHICSPVDIDKWKFIMFYIDPNYYKCAGKFENIVKLKGEKLHLLKEFINLLQIENDQALLETNFIEMLMELVEVSYDDKQVAESEYAVIKELGYTIGERFSENLTLKDMEELSHLNRFTIIRQFKKIYNTTPRAFQLQLKVAEAKKLLTMGREVFDVVDEVGFYDQAHFIREFKKMNGITPNGYQQNII